MRKLLTTLLLTFATAFSTVFTIVFATSLAMTSIAVAATSPFSPVLPEQVPSGMAYSISLPPVESPTMFAGKRVAILASHGVEEAEITYPYIYLTSRGATVDILVPEWTPAGITSVRYLKPTLWVKATGTFRQAAKTSYDLLVITGGAWNAQVVRTDGDALALITNHFRAHRPIAAVCAGSAVLISAGIAHGATMTGSPPIALDIRNAGAHYVDQPLVMDRGLATSRSPDDLPFFVTGIRRLLIGK